MFFEYLTHLRLLKNTRSHQRENDTHNRINLVIVRKSQEEIDIGRRKLTQNSFENKNCRKKSRRKNSTDKFMG